MSMPTFVRVRPARKIYPFIECTRDGNARPTSRTNEDSETRVKSRRLYTPARERRQMDETQTPNTKSQTPNSKSRTRTGAGVPKFQFDVAFGIGRLKFGIRILR